MKRAIFRRSWLVLMVSLALLLLAGAVTAAPGPAQVAPVGNATFDTNDILFEFGQVANGTWYNIVAMVDGNVGLNEWYEAATLTPNLNNNYEVTAGVTGIGPAEWYVRAWVGSVSQGSMTDYSGPATFSITFAPSGLVDDSADTASRGDVTYTWDYDLRVTWAHMEVTNNSNQEIIHDAWYEVNGGDNVLQCDDVSFICSTQPLIVLMGTPGAPGSYSWRIQEWGPLPNTISAWSASQSMNIAYNPPDANNFDVNLFFSAATDTITDGDQPFYVFNDIANASWYNLVVVDSNGKAINDSWYRRSLMSGCADINAQCQALATFYDTGVVYLPNGLYDWYVRAWGPGGMSVNGLLGYGYSDPARTVQIDNPAVDTIVPLQMSPINDAIVNDPNAIVFEWQPEQGVTWWNLRIYDGGGAKIFDGWKHYRGTAVCPPPPNEVNPACVWATTDVLPNGSYQWDLRGWGPSQQFTKDSSSKASFTVSIP